MTTFEITFTWKPVNAPCSVHYVVHNNNKVVSSGTVLSKSGQKVTYTAGAAPVHLIAWALDFTGDKRQDLTAKVSVNGGSPVALDANDEAFHLWKSWKVIG